jgi:YfiH family protein
MSEGAASAAFCIENVGTGTGSVATRDDELAVFSPALAAFPDLVHGSTTRAFQASLPGELTRIQEMHAACEILGAAGFPIYSGEQKHTCNVAVVSDEEDRAGTGNFTFSQTDALITSKPGVALAIQTADCAPIFLYDPANRVAGLAHGGWRGTLARIAEKTVAAMANIGAEPRNTIAWIGPMAAVCCYEVNQELIDRFSAEFADLPAPQVHSGRHLDLVSINAHQLTHAGLSPANVHVSGICTIHQNHQFFSYRADNGTAGRILSIIAMRQ